MPAVVAAAAAADKQLDDAVDTGDRVDPPADQRNGLAVDTENRYTLKSSTIVPGLEQVCGLKVRGLVGTGATV